MSVITAEDANEREARIERMNAETRKFVIEHEKLMAEAKKLGMEKDKLERDYQLAPWTLVASTIAATTALIGAGAALFKLVHG